jgi:putative transposase
MLAVNCVSNHVHAFVGLKSPVAISDIARDIKSNSSRFINDHKWVKGVFRWQEGYGVFSYSHSHIDNLVKYILNQEEHHKKTSFKEEYLSFLKKFDVDYDDQYLFDWDE